MRIDWNIREFVSVSEFLFITFVTVSTYLPLKNVWFFDIQTTYLSVIQLINEDNANKLISCNALNAKVLFIYD